MKISEKAKGLVDYTSKYRTTIDEFYPADEDEELFAHSEEVHNAELLEDAENKRITDEWEKHGQLNLNIICNTPDAIAKRLTYLFTEKKIEKAEFARDIGLGRSTIHRYVCGTSTPTEKTLVKIIEGLSMSIADFCYEPKDFDKWKSALEDTIAKQKDIFKLKEYVLKELLRNDFTYQLNGNTLMLSNKHFELLKQIITDGFSVLDLIQHDN